MASTPELGTATGDERIDGASLQPAIRALLALAESLGATIPDAPDIDAVQAIGAAQAALNDRALALVDAQIQVLAGGVLVTAGHINTATEYARAAVDAMADWKKKIAACAPLVDFIGAVLTGDGVKMLETAVKLKSAL